MSCSYQAYLGGDHRRGRLNIKNPKKDLNDGRWHNMSLIQEGRLAKLKVDSVESSSIIREDYKDLNLDTIYVGGMKPATYRLYRVGGTRNFRGCLEDLTFRGKNLISGAKGELLGYDSVGKVSFKCEELDYRVVTMSNPNVGFRVTVKKLPADNDTFYASFRFRSHVEEGLLLSRSAVKVKLHLRLSAGSLLYDVTAPNGSKTVLRLGSNLDDGEWHNVNASVRGREVRLQLDGQTALTKPLNHSLLMQEFANRSRLKIFLGGFDDNRDFPGFVGCILNLQIDSQKIFLRNLKKSKHTNEDLKYACRLVNRCQPNPCKNDGHCSQDWQSFYCDCAHTQFEGDTCEISKYRPACEYYRAMGLKTTMRCLIDSVGDGDPYTALCNVTDDPKRTYTIINHNKMTKIRVSDANIIGTLYKHEITYSNSISMQQIIKLIENSKECRQHIRFHCFSSKLLNTPRGPSHAFWLSRDDKRQDYWGGAEPGSKKCACGMMEPTSCEGTAKFCNCDNKDSQWRVDEGYLTDKSTLPVTGLEFNKKSAKSDFTLGPLECWGTLKEKKNSKKSDPSIHMTRLKKACPKAGPSTPSSTRSASPTTSPTPSSTKGLCPNGIEGECANSSSSSPGVTTLPASGNVEETRQTTPRDQEISLNDSASEISTIAIVMISAALVVIVLLSMKFALPRVIMCVRTHSKRGEYIVPPAGSSGYPARLLPLVTKRSSVRGRQLTQSGANGRYVDGNAAGGLKSYWV